MAPIARRHHHRRPTLPGKRGDVRYDGIVPGVDREERHLDGADAAMARCPVVICVHGRKGERRGSADEAGEGVVVLGESGVFDGHDEGQALGDGVLGLVEREGFVVLFYEREDVAAHAAEVYVFPERTF